MPCWWGCSCPASPTSSTRPISPSSGAWCTRSGFDGGRHRQPEARRPRGRHGARRGQAKELAKLTGGTGEIPTGAPERKSKAREKWEGEERGGQREAQRSRSEVDDEGAARREGHGRGGRPRALAEPGAQPRARDRRRRCSIAPASSSRSSIATRRAARRACRSRSRGSTYVGAAPARVSRAARERQQGSGAGESALELDRRKVRDRIAELKEGARRHPGGSGPAPLRAEGSAPRRARRLHERRQVVADARAHGQRRAGRRQALRHARHHRARAPARDAAAHPRLRHRRLHQEAAARSRRLVSARRSTRRSRRRCCSTSSTPRTPPAEAQLEVTRERAAGDRRRGGAEPAACSTRSTASRPSAAPRCSRSTPTRWCSRRTRPPTSRRCGSASSSTSSSSMVEAELVIPYAKQAVVAEVYENARVLSEDVRRDRTAARAAGAPGGGGEVASLAVRAG